MPTPRNSEGLLRQVAEHISKMRGGISRGNKNSISFTLDLAEWPDDVPLPPEATLSQRGPKRLAPRREIFLEAHKTIDIVGGLFDVPHALEMVASWYQQEMMHLGWAIDKEGGLTKSEGASQWLHFRHLDEPTTVKIFLQYYPYKQSTSVFTKRITVQADYSDTKSNVLTGPSVQNGTMVTEQKQHVMV